MHRDDLNIVARCVLAPMRVVIAVTVISLLTCCTSHPFERQIQSIADKLESTDGRDTSVWSSLTNLRPLLIEHDCKECDSVYNSLVALVTKTATRYMPGESLYALSLAHNDPSSHMYTSTILPAHELRYWGNYNAARAQYSARRDEYLEYADGLGNLSMEYERIGLLHASYNMASQADSLFRARNNSHARLWTLRLLYNANMRLGYEAAALSNLRTYRQLSDELEKSSAYNLTDTTTEINLVASIRRNAGSDSTSHLREAFGQRYHGKLNFFHDYNASQKSPELGLLWDTRRTDCYNIPKPIIRAVPFESLRLWIDSLCYLPHGRLGVHSRYGTYRLEGSTWRLWTERSIANSSIRIRPCNLPMIDTICNPRGHIRALMPLGGDTLIVFTQDSVLIHWNNGSTRHILPRAIRSTSNDFDVTTIDSTSIAIANSIGVFVLNRHSFKVKSYVHYSHATVSPVHIPMRWNAMVKMTASNVLVVKQPNTDHVWALTYDKVLQDLRFIRITNQSRVLPGWRQLSELPFDHLSGASLAVYASTGMDTVQLCETNAPIASIGWLKSGSRKDQRLHAPQGVVAVRLYEHLDIIDTVRRISIPQYAVPFPADADGFSDIGLFRDSYGRISGYYTDGNVVMSIPLSQVTFPLRPALFVGAVTQSDREMPKEVTNDTELEPNCEYIFHVRSNLLINVYPLSTNIRDSQTVSLLNNTLPYTWQVVVSPKATDTTVVIDVPGLGTKHFIPVRRSFTSRPWFLPTALVLSMGIFVMIVTTGVISRRKRHRASIADAKAKQLELLREDMHDMIGSRLVRIASLARQASPENNEEVLARIHDMTIVTVRSLRNLLTLMAESSMTDQDFYGSMREYVAESCKDARIDCTIEVEVSAASSLDNAGRHELLMIISEMLTNTIRHASATKARFSISSNAHQTVILWSDNGTGIDPDAKRGNGLHNIHRRAHRINAQVRAESIQGQGTTYTIAFPSTIQTAI